MVTTLVLALLASTAAAPPAKAAAPTRCQLPRFSYAAPRHVKARPQKLGDEPPASHYLAVDRHVGGCPAPAIVRTGIGGGK